MRQTGESERESGGNNDAERERTSESEIEDLGARLDKACASRPLDRAQHGMTRRTAATHLLTAVLWLATAVILLAMLLRMCPTTSTANGTCRYRRADAVVGMLSLIIAITAIAVRAIGGRVLLATVSVVCVVVQIGWHWGYIRPQQTISDAASTAVTQVSSDGLPNTSDRYARIMTFNTKEGHADANRIVEIVKNEHVEVLALQEVSWDLLNRLNGAGIANYLPYSVAAQQTWHDNGGVNVLYSAAPMENAKQNLIPVESSSVSAATIDFGGSKVRFGSVHPFSPRPRNQGLWNRSLDSLAQLQHYDNLYVLMGDFNSTWDHARLPIPARQPLPGFRPAGGRRPAHDVPGHDANRRNRPHRA